MAHDKGYGDWLQNALPRLGQYRALLGFDGFIDQIAALDGFRGMRGLADYLYERDGMSGALEMDVICRKMGGNMPITAHALGCLGLPSDCVGALGGDTADAIFSGMSENCSLHPVIPPVGCLALEFDTGKLMLTDNKSIKALDFSSIINRIGLETLISMHADAVLWGYFNWSELTGMTDILRGALDSILPQLQEAERIVFFDLSDCTARPVTELRDALALMRAFGTYARTVLSLNENEARYLLRVCCETEIPNVEPDDTVIAGYLTALYAQLGLSDIVIRRNKRVYAYDGLCFAAVDTFYVSNPQIMTGAGDNYNAGIMAALLLGADWTQSLTLGALTSSFYIRNGYSPSAEEVCQAAYDTAIH